MNERDYLAERFEEHRAHLRAVAYRMLGSLSEVDDAVQEAWLRLSRAESTAIDNLGGWLTTVVARVCLDMLRSRQSRREEPLPPDAPEPVATGIRGSSPEQEALLADSVGLALLVVLDRLTPAERLAIRPVMVQRAKERAPKRQSPTNLRAANRSSEICKSRTETRSEAEMEAHRPD
jgi:RNA polymerase sigma factor (sigma-70 family)